MSGDLHSSMRDLNLLAELIGGALPPANDSFKLTLFPDTSMDGPAGIGQPASAAPARRRQQPMTMMAAPSGRFTSREDMFVMIYADTYAVPQPCRMYRLRLPAS